MKIDITAAQDLRAAGNAAYHRGAETNDSRVQDQGKAMLHASYTNRRMLRKAMRAVKSAPAKHKAAVVEKIGILVAKGRQPPAPPAPTTPAEPVQVSLHLAGEQPAAPT
jgi:hypothetical protein